MYIFMKDNFILGICDEEHLKESAKEVWIHACANGDEDSVIINKCDVNVVDYNSPPFSTYRFCKYDNNTKVGIRLMYISDSDIRLGIEA